MSDIILFNRNNLDAYTAAWIGTKSISGEVDVKPYSPGYNPDRICGYDRVWIINYNIAKTILVTLCMHNREVCVISNSLKDDRLNSWGSIPSNLTLFVDILKPVTETAIIVFKSRTLNFADYVIDAVRGNYDLQQSRLVSKAIDALRPFDFDKFEKIQTELISSLSNVVVSGKTVEGLIVNMVEQQIFDTSYIIISNIKALIANCTVYIKECGVELAKRSSSGVSITWRAVGSIFIFSIRTTSKSKVNALDIAKKYNGGGGPFCAGFKCSADVANELFKTLHIDRNRSQFHVR